MKAYIKLLDKLEKAICYFGIVVLFVMAGSTFLQVLTRYIFKYSIPWTNELAQFGFIIATMLGAAVAAYNSAHIRITLVANKLPRKLSFAMFLLADVLIFACALLITIPGYNFVSANIHNLSTALEVPLWIPMSSVPISGVLMAMFCIGGMYKLIDQQEGTESAAITDIVNEEGTEL